MDWGGVGYLCMETPSPHLWLYRRAPGSLLSGPERWGTDWTPDCKSQHEGLFRYEALAYIQYNNAIDHWILFLQKENKENGKMREITGDCLSYPCRAPVQPSTLFYYYFLNKQTNKCTQVWPSFVMCERLTLFPPSLLPCVGSQREAKSFRNVPRSLHPPRSQSPCASLEKR